MWGYTRSVVVGVAVGVGVGVTAQVAARWWWGFPMHCHRVITWQEV